MATFDDVGARVICGGLHPDHATNARFTGRHKEPLKGLLVQSLVACAQEGLVRVDLAAGDGTKVKANASMAANATAEQLGLDIAGLEKLLEAEVQAWIEQARAADAAEDALFSGEGRDGGPPAGPGRPGAKRTAGKLARRQAARAKLAAQEQARQEQAEAERQAKIARLAAEKDRLEARAAQELAKGQAKVDRYAQRAAAAAAGTGRRQRGRAPWPAERQRDVRASRRGGRAGRGQAGRGDRRPRRAAGPGPAAEGEHHRPGQPGHAAEEGRLRPAV